MRAWHGAGFGLERKGRTMAKPIRPRETPHTDRALRRMGQEDAAIWWRSMTEEERARMDVSGTIRGNIEYDKGFRDEWRRIVASNAKGKGQQ